MKLPLDFYIDENTLDIAKNLIGKVLYTNINNILTSGIISETEAYCGIEDKACHSYGNRKTKRTQVMFLKGGITYIYICYGLHYLFNIVTNKENMPHAVLIRAIKPLDGIDHIIKRRKKNKFYPDICKGPGSMSQGMGITKQLNEQSLNGNTIWIEDNNIKINKIFQSERIGIDYAGEYTKKPWRFFVN